MVHRRTFCALILACLGCASDSADDTGAEKFLVGSSVPEQGDVDVRQSQIPEFHLNAPADMETCNESNVLLVGIDESGEFAFDVEHTVAFLDEGNKLVINHTEPFLRGYWYAAMTIQTEEPCRSDEGLPLEPYGVEFYVP